MLDSRGWYTPDEAAALFEALDQLDGGARVVYAVTALTIDLVFPVCYGLLLAVLLFWLYRDGAPLYLLPLALALADVLENVTVAALALSYDGAPVPLAWLAAVFTLFKTALIVATLVVVINGGDAPALGTHAAPTPMSRMAVRGEVTCAGHGGDRPGRDRSLDSTRENHASPPPSPPMLLVILCSTPVTRSMMWICQPRTHLRPGKRELTGWLGPGRHQRPVSTRSHLLRVLSMTGGLNPGPSLGHYGRGRLHNPR